MAGPFKPVGIDDDSLFPARVESRLDSSYGAEAMSNPESALNGATVQVVEGVFGAGVTGVPYFFNGALEDSAAARPAWNGVVVWRVFEGDPTPTNIGPNDEIDEVEAVPLPDVLVWADDFNRANGPLTTTATGGLPYQLIGGTGSVWSVVGNQAALTAGTGGAGGVVVDAGHARTLFEATIATQDAGFYGGVMLRVVDQDNYFALARVSSGDPTTRFVKRIGGVSTDVKVFTGVSLDNASVIRDDDRVLGQWKLYIDDVLVFDETVDTAVPVNALTSATKRGFYLGSQNISTTADNVRFDDASCYRVA